MDEQRAVEEGHVEQSPETPAVAPDQTHIVPPEGTEDSPAGIDLGWSLRGDPLHAGLTSATEFGELLV